MSPLQGSGFIGGGRLRSPVDRRPVGLSRYEQPVDHSPFIDGLSLSQISQSRNSGLQFTRHPRFFEMSVWRLVLRGQRSFARSVSTVKTSYWRRALSLPEPTLPTSPSALPLLRYGAVETTPLILRALQRIPLTHSYLVKEGTRCAPADWGSLASTLRYTK